MTKAYADKNRLAYVGSKPGNALEAATDAWFTPSLYIDSARKVLGSFDLDPFSDAHANKTIRAKTFFDGALYGDAFTQAWKGKNIWMNPPYSRGLCAKAVDRLLQAMSEGEHNAVVLVNNATDVAWWDRLSKSRHCMAICFTDHRIAFANIDGKNTSGNTRGQAFWLLSSVKAARTRRALLSRFKKEFARHGNVWKGVAL